MTIPDFDVILLTTDEIKSLHSVLKEEEFPERVARVTKGFATGVLVATNQRLLFLNKTLMSLKIDEFHWPHVHDVAIGKSLGAPTLAIIHGNDRVEFTQINKHAIETLASYLDSKRHGSTLPQNGSEEQERFVVKTSINEGLSRPEERSNAPSNGESSEFAAKRTNPTCGQHAVAFLITSILGTIVLAIWGFGVWKKFAIGLWAFIGFAFVALIVLAIIFGAETPSAASPTSVPINLPTTTPINVEATSIAIPASTPTPYIRPTRVPTPRQNTKPTPVPTPRRTTPTRAIQPQSVSFSVTSNSMMVGRKQINLDRGRYTLSKTTGCIAAELATLPSDELIVYMVDESRATVNVPPGRYMLRALGNDCRATLTR